MGKFFGEKIKIRYPKQLLRTLRRLQPDVVVAYEFHLECILASLYAAASGCRYVTWSDVTQPFDAYMGGMRMLIRRFLLERSHSLIGSSSATLNYFQSRFHFPEDKSFLSILCAHVEEFRALVPSSPRLSGNNDQPVRFVYVGRLLPYKGLDLLIEEFATVHRDLPRTVLTLIGEGPERLRIEKIAIATGCGEAVRFKGFMPHHQLARELICHDVFVFPTRAEPFGLVVAEAMACGLPIICSCNAGAAPDLIAENGIIVDPFRTGDLARAMTQLAQHPNLRSAMSKANACILDQFSLVGAVDGFLSAIRRAVEHRAQPSTGNRGRRCPGCSVSSLS
jgi:glycosyltransferase involved in cell wall biosynthesis